jgi:hypothetical protein
MAVKKCRQLKKTFHPTKFYDWSIHGRFGNGHFGNGLSGMIPWWPCAQVHNVDTGLPVSIAAGLTMLCENASGVSFSPPAPGDPLRCSGTTCGTCGQPWWMGSCGQYGRRESAWGAELCLHVFDVRKASAAAYFVVFYLSNQRTPSILLWHRMWNACRWAVSALVVVHVSDARSSIGTIRKYTSLFSFVKKGRSRKAGLTPDALQVTHVARFDSYPAQ